MKTISRLATVAVVVTGIGTAALAQHAGHNTMDMASMQKMMQSMMPSASDGPSTKGLKDAHMKMMHGMNTEYTGDADVDFSRSMIAHHQGAIDMAQVQLAHGKDPEVRALAEKIIEDQKKEIAQIEAWLKKATEIDPSLVRGVPPA